MTKSKTVQLAVELTDHQARAFAEFLHCAAASEAFRDKVKDATKILHMESAAAHIRIALSDAGYDAPRQ
jgi:hypothetical protein